MSFKNIHILDMWPVCSSSSSQASLVLLRLTTCVHVQNEVMSTIRHDTSSCLGISQKEEKKQEKSLFVLIIFTSLSLSHRHHFSQKYYRQEALDSIAAY